MIMISIIVLQNMLQNSKTDKHKTDKQYSNNMN